MFRLTKTFRGKNIDNFSGGADAEIQLVRPLFMGSAHASINLYRNDTSEKLTFFSACLHKTEINMLFTVSKFLVMPKQNGMWTNQEKSEAKGIKYSQICM